MLRLRGAFVNEFPEVSRCVVSQPCVAGEWSGLRAFVKRGSGGFARRIFVGARENAADGAGAAVAHVEGLAQSFNDSSLMFEGKFGVDGQ